MRVEYDGEEGGVNKMVVEEFMVLETIPLPSLLI